MNIIIKKIHVCNQRSFEFEQFMEKFLVAMKAVHNSPKRAADWFTCFFLPVLRATGPKGFPPSICLGPNSLA